MQTYQDKKQHLIAQAQEIIKSGGKLALGKKTSNLFRSHRVPSKRLDVSHFNQVIKIDQDNLFAEVEGMTTYETLVNATLKYDCLPTVVPQLKTITIGGALTGLGIESSSFRYGLVHETILEFDLLLGDGTVATCRPDNEYRDLFFAFPNTYGSLGYALKVKVQLIPVKKYVKLTHLHFTDPTLYFQELRRLCETNRIHGPVSYIDGVAFDKNELKITLGEFCEEAPYVSNYTYMNVYYRSIKNKDHDYLTTYDYIWRWDTDWFWCSSHFGMQNPIIRFLFGKFLLKSSAYWKMMSFARSSRLINFLRKQLEKPTESVIQDVLIPIQRSAEFYNFFNREIGITPIWLCPSQNYRSNVKYDFWDLPADTLFIDFGFWDTVAAGNSEGYYNILIENKIPDFGGMKSLYSDVYYSEKQFWNIYDEKLYKNLKTKYDPNSSLKSLYEKISER